MKDWVGNQKSIFTALGASNHTDKEREKNDYYATDPVAIDKLIPTGVLSNVTNIWECCCGEGHLSERLKHYGFKVLSTDLIDRNYGVGGVNYLTSNKLGNVDCILTNPPYKYALEIIKHSLDILEEGQLCCMFLKTTFIEGKKRYKELFSVNPPKYIYQFSERVNCAMNGDFEKYNYNSAVAYAWYVWEKGYKGDTILRWI